MIYLAYDGSLNGDWVARYAIRFAAHSAERTLSAVHVDEGRLAAEALDGKLEHLGRECRARGVEFLPEVVPLRRTVFRTLLEQVPAGEESFLVCGTRVRSRQQAYLSGTVAEKLLHFNPFHVLAIRVVQPGLLGCPRDFLLPLAGHPRLFRAAWPFFRLFLPDVEQVYLLRGMAVSHLRLRYLSPARLAALREGGARYLAEVEEEIRRGRGGAEFHLDSRIVVCDDWAHEILVHASRLRTRMVLLGASERALLHRLLRGNSLERVLRGAPCDVGIYRSP